MSKCEGKIPLVFPGPASWVYDLFNYKEPPFSEGSHAQRSLRLSLMLCDHPPEILNNFFFNKECNSFILQWAPQIM